MNKIIIAACVTAVHFITACSNNKQDHDSDLDNKNSFESATKTSDSQNLINANTALSDTGQLFIEPITQSSLVNPPSSTGSVSGINPPHGEPGHRCDIEVGAPLSSPVKQPAVQNITSTTMPAIQATDISTKNANTKTATPAGMNPPHGEPGHRCDIAVGQPLNSPVKEPSTKTISPTQIPTPVIYPPQIDSGS